MGYLAAFLGALVVDTVPVFAPPAWTLLVLLVVRFNLDVWLAVTLGALGSTLGRYLFSLYIRKFSRKVLSDRENENVAFLGKHLGGKSWWPSFVFVLLYSLTPLSTTVLFTAAAAGQVSPRRTLPPFLIGKFTSDAVMVFYGRHAAGSMGGLLRGQASPQSLIMLALGLLFLVALVFIDWKALLLRKRLRLHLHILR